MASGKGLYYGWILVAVGLICYGFGISPPYYSWGFYTPDMSEELDFTARQMGGIFGVLVFVLSVVSPLTGIAIGRFGLRTVTTLGALTCALSFWLTSRSHAAWEFYLYFAVLGGAGLGFSTVLPWQTVATYWFRKYLARALAIMFTGGALVGMAVNPINAATLDGVGWRTGWVIIAAISFLVAILSYVFVRQNPEQMGLHPDGIEPRKGNDANEGAAKTGDDRTPESHDDEPQWTARTAIRTPQFWILTFAAIAYSIPWGVVSAHGGAHLRTMLGFSKDTAARMLSARIGVSALGRILASFGDLVKPQIVLAFGLLLETLAVGILAVARTSGAVYFAMTLLGLGYGLSYISSPVVIGRFFGRKAFATTNGSRILTMAGFQYLAPTLAGWVADRTGAYSIAYFFLMALAIAGALGAVVVKPPVPPAVAATDPPK